MERTLQNMLDKWRKNNRAMRRIVKAVGGRLNGANLIGSTLRDADLHGALLSDAILSGTDLSDANLSDADLSRADLSGANLIGANLRRSNLTEAQLKGAAIDLPVSMSARKARPALVVGWDEWVLGCWCGTTAKTIERILSNKPTPQALSYLHSMAALAADEAFGATPEMRQQLRDAIAQLEDNEYEQEET